MNLLITSRSGGYFTFKAVKFKFNFPQPSFLEGVKSKGKFLIKMDNVSLTYPGNVFLLFKILVLELQWQVELLV